jgi:diguanylate cyclase (GGDEF)-like protein
MPDYTTLASTLGLLLSGTVAEAQIQCFVFGGEEFLILLPKTSLSEAITLAEKIRISIAKSPVFSDKLIIEVIVSGGVAEWDSQEININSTLKRADKALYQAKEKGRDFIMAG